MSCKILVVEDSPTMRQLISFSLRSIAGAMIVEAVDGLDGLKKLQAGGFDLAIVDINMPVMDGLKLISLIRKDEKSREMPVVIVSTESDDQTRKRAEAFGVNAYITKPVISGNVLKTVRSLLESSENGDGRGG